MEAQPEGHELFDQENNGQEPQEVFADLRTRLAPLNPGGLAGFLDFHPDVATEVAPSLAGTLKAYSRVSFDSSDFVRATV
jgi:hypothetical protein